MSSHSQQTKVSSALDGVFIIPWHLRRLFFTIYCRLYKAYYTFFLIQFIQNVYYTLVSILLDGKRKLEWKTHWQSPVCHSILKRKYIMSHSKSSLSWAVFFFSLALILLFDMNTKSIASLFPNYSDFIWYFELIVMLVITCNACIAAVFYLWAMFSKPIPISPVYQRLFGINEKDPGFELKKESSTTPEVQENCLRFSSWRDSDCSSFLSVTPLNYSAKSWASTPSYGLDSTSSSWTYYCPSSPNAYTSTPKSKHTDSALMRKRMFSDSIDSSSEKLIRNNQQLEEFLKTCEEEKKMKSMSFDESLPSVTTLDSSPLSILGKCRYQRACRLPSMETIENDSSETLYGDTLHKLKISEKMLTVWCERLRKWICQTILVKLVTEIDDINNTLNQLGLPEYQIGTVNLFALHQIAITKFQHLTTLPAVLPYLDLHLNQEYLVQRLRDLSRGGCMGEFKWNSGGSYGDKHWCDDLPTDAAIIIHVLCCYLDAYLPPEPHFPEGKPFSSKYFRKTPEKHTTAKDLHFIYQSSINPPHFKVVIRQDVYSLPKGRNNLFYALLVFFHYLKTKESGMLGRVNLGPSGLNMLWVID